MIDQAEKLRRMASERRGSGALSNLTSEASPGAPLQVRCQSIAITSGKGGVGKTNISLFLALALTSLNKRVLLFDADLGLANVHILLGKVPRRDISHVISGECGFDEIILHGPNGIHIMPAAAGMESMANLDASRLEMLYREMTALERNYDFILIDTGAGIGAISTGFAVHSDAAILVATAEPTSLSDAYAVLKILNRNNGLKIWLLVNMATSDDEAREVHDKLNKLSQRFLQKQIELLGTLPYSKELQSAVRHQKIVVLDNPKSLLAERIKMSARKLCGLSFQKKEGFFTRLFKRGAV